jgi:hypothetical protein
MKILMMVAKFQGLVGMGILMCMPAMAQSIVPNSIEDSACYFKTNQGSIIDLNGICGYSQPKDREKRTQPSASNSPVLTPSPIPENREFRPVVGANPSNPFGRNPASSNSNQCYVVDSDGDRCNSNP